MENFWQIRDIKPASLSDIQKRIDDAYAFAANASDEKYGRGRDATAILQPGNDYAELPGWSGRTPRQIIEELLAGSAVLDVGCGYGELGAEILSKINPGVEVYGFDAQKQPGQERLKEVAVGNVDALAPELFGGRQFDLVVSSALLYHLPDYWGAVLRMARMLRPGGVLLASTMPRILREVGEPVDDQNGLCEADNDTFFYFRDRNVFDTAGVLVPTAELIELLNTRNADFRFAYTLAAGNEISGSKNVGGQLAARRQGELPPNLENIFYCLSKGNLGYVVARNEAEASGLASRGFVSLAARL
jgi:2-polyprenyl-3-methyl-5-hydroxy-6-metoxy-1,4-benzoquinol methylase